MGDAFSSSSKVISSAFAYVEKNEKLFHKGRIIFLVTNFTPSSQNLSGSPLTTGELIKYALKLSPPNSFNKSSGSG